MLGVAKNVQKCKPSAFIGHTAYIPYKPSAVTWHTTYTPYTPSTIAGHTAYILCKASAIIRHTAYRMLHDGAVSHLRCGHVADVFAECLLEAECFFL